MYELSPGWEVYYREDDPKRRRGMLDEMFTAEADDGANMFRLRLWEARHLDAKQPKAEVDRFLFQFVNLIQVYRTARMFRRNAARQVEQAMREMLLPEAEAYGVAGECAVYWELRNAAVRYLKICESPAYNRALFGMVASKDSAKRIRVCQEIWEMTRGLADRTGMEQQMQIWNRAVLDAYFQYDAGAQERMAEFEAKNS